MVKVNNSTNHELCVYHYNSDKFQSNRENGYLYLKDKTYRPYLVIERGVVLNEQSANPIRSNCFEVSLSTSRLHFQFDVLPDFWNYDCIIVSHHYAEAAIRLFANQTHPDFADRLFEVDQRIKNEHNKTIGCCGFRKVFPFRTPRDYLNTLNAGLPLSLPAVRLCYDYYYNRWATGCYPNILTDIEQLRCWLISEEARRSASHQQQIFHV